MNKSLNIAIILTAYDKATRVINDAVTKSERRLKDMKNASQDAFGKGIALTGAGMAIAAPLVQATEAAIGFEDKMADVAKVMGLTVGSDPFLKMGEQAKQLGVYLGRTAEEAAGLMANLAAGGVEAAEMEKVGKIAGEMGIAFNMTADDAGTAFIKIRNALGVTTDEAKKVGDAINYLSDSMASEANEIVNFMASGGSSVAASFKVGGKEAAAFGSTLISVGKSSSEAATIFERFTKGVFKNDAMKGIFDQAGGGASGLVAVLEAGKNAKDQFAFFRQFGEYGSDIALLASRSDMLKDALGGVADQTKILNSVNNEFANRNSTTQGGLNKLKASFDVLTINLGQVFLPAVNAAASALAKVAGYIAEWAAANPRLAKTLGFVAAAVSGVLLLAGAFFIVKGAILAVSVVMAANPIGLVLMGIAVAAAVIMANWDAIGPFFARLWANIVRVFSAAWSFITNIFMKYTPHGLIITHWSKIVGFFVDLWERVKQTFLSVWQWIKGLSGQMYQAGVDLIQGLVDGIKAMANKPIEAVQDMANNIKGKFKNILGIQSPSKVFMQFGHHITAGASMGMNSGMDKVRNASQAMAQTIIRPMAQPSLAGGGGGGVSVNYAPVINFTGTASADSRSEFLAMLRQHSNEVMRVVKEAQDRRNRTSY